MKTIPYLCYSLNNYKIMNILTENQLNAVKLEIKDELTKRGFHVDINLVEEETKHGNKLRLSSSNFQTNPVLFKELSLVDFGTKVEKTTDCEIFGGDDETELIRVWLTVSVAYNHFNLGSNCSKLFTFSCLFEPSMDQCFDVKFK